MKISIDRVNSIAIRNEYLAAHCNHADYLGTFYHPNYSNSPDWNIELYSVCDQLVFSTNGDPVWKDTTPADFDILVAEYGINIEEALAE
jgi:hypothetical protein